MGGVQCDGGAMLGVGVVCAAAWRERACCLRCQLSSKPAINMWTRQQEHVDNSCRRKP